MTKHFLYIILFLLVALHTKATNLVIEVKEDQSNIVLENAIVSYTQNKQQYAFPVPLSGKVVLKNIEYPIKIKVQSLSYESITKTIKAKDITSLYGDDYLLVQLKKINVQLNELVVTAQTTPQLAKQSIYKVNSINSAQIAQRGAVSVNDVLGYEVNHFISNDNLLGSSVSIGGIGGQNVKVLVNGVPIMGRENGNIDLGQLSVNNIKRIEMIQGPMSVIYGSNALGGVINIITKTPQKKMAFGIRSYTESIGKYNFFGDMSLQRKKHQVQVSLSRNFFQGWTPEDSVDRYQLWKPKTQYASDLQYNYENKKTKVNYYSSYLYEKITNKGVPIVNPYDGYAFDEYYKTQRIINSLGLNYVLSTKEQLSFSNSYSIYKRTKNRFRKDLVSLEQFQTHGIGDQDTTRFDDINARGTLSSKRFKNMDVLLGYEYTYELGKSYKLADDEQSMSDIGVFASATYTHKKISVQPSCRMTYSNRFNKATTPALHLKYDLNQRTQIRASYARGFRAPTLKEMYLQFVDQNHTIIGNPELKPEIGDHLEFGIEHQAKLAHATLSIGLNAYANAITNLITLAIYNNHGVLRQYANIQEYQNGILNVQAKYASSRLKFNTAMGCILVNKSETLPQHVILEISPNLSYWFKSINTTFNFNYKFNSKQPVLTVDQQFLYTSALHIANASLQKSFFKKSLALQVGVKNLFNLQNTPLSGAVDLQSGGHTSASGMQLFPERSLFMDIQYHF